MIANKLSEDNEPLVTAFILHFFRLVDYFVLNYKVNLLVAKIFF